ncbi:MAG: tetratricopeptide repeat protein [bacterium]|nr:tetratricopeptide repeat protein [bacterium]
MNEIEKAFRQVEKTQEIDPNLPEALNMKGWLYLEKQEYKKAIAVFEEAGKVPGNESETLSGLGMIYGRMGDMESAGKYLNRLLDLQKEMPGISFYFKIGLVYNEMGDTDNMFLYLNKSLEAGETELNFLDCFIFLKKYHSDPRYIEIKEKGGFPDA